MPTQDSYLWHRMELYPLYYFYLPMRGRRGRDRMVVRFTPTYATSAYHH
jgi:hypothetical protein